MFLKNLEGCFRNRDRLSAAGLTGNAENTLSAFLFLSVDCAGIVQPATHSTQQIFIYVAFNGKLIFVGIPLGRVFTVLDEGIEILFRQEVRYLFSVDVLSGNQFYQSAGVNQLPFLKAAPLSPAKIIDYVIGVILIIGVFAVIFQIFLKVFLNTI